MLHFARRLASTVFVLSVAWGVLELRNASAHSPGHAIPDVATPATSGWGFTLGGAAMLAPKFEGSRNYGVKPLPVVEIRYADWFRLSYASGARIDALALADVAQTPFGRFSAGPLVRYVHGRSPSDDDALRGFRSVDGAIEAGGFLGFARGPWDIDLAFAQALNDGSHEALLADATAGYRFQVTEAMTGRLGGKLGWASARYMSEMFGIDAATSRAAGLPVYAAKSGFKDAGVTLAFQHALGKGLSLNLVTGYSRLLGSAADSPLVSERGARDQLLGSIGASFRF